MFLKKLKSRFSKRKNEIYPDIGIAASVLNWLNPEYHDPKTWETITLVLSNRKTAALCVTHGFKINDQKEAKLREYYVHFKSETRFNYHKIDASSEWCVVAWLGAPIEKSC